jgi:hypothetical protein
MARRLSFDDSALFRTWERSQEKEQHNRELVTMTRPRSFQEDLLCPRPRAPSPMSMFRSSIHRIERVGSPRWTLLPSPLQSLDTIAADIWDVKVLKAKARASRASVRSFSMSSTASDDSICSLMSDLDQSIASWSSDAFDESSRTLRKRKTPRRESLRDIRTKQSEWQLQQAYQSSLEAYLDDSVIDAFKPLPLRSRQSQEDF